MDILGIGPLELLFILLIAMVVVGPRNLGKAGRSIGRFLNRLYRSENWRLINEASRNLRNLPSRLAREAALEELDAVRNDLAATGRDLTQDIRDLNAGLRAWQAPSKDSVEAKQGDRDRASRADTEAY